MYDDLARTQQPPPLEWFVVRAVIPSVALTLVLRLPAGQVCQSSFRPFRDARSETMKAFSSAVSISLHAAVGAAVLLGTTKTGRSDVQTTLVPQIVFPPVQNENHDDAIGGPSIPGPIVIPQPDFGQIPLPSLPQTGATTEAFSRPAGTSGATSGTNEATGWAPLLSEQPAEVLSGPLPAYPELLRQAGVQGRVVLEAVVDTTGRVLPQSVSVVSATNPGFVAPARQALLATLFRPAMTGGKPARLRVRIPYDFTIRNGIGRAR